jgi:pyruvate-ferredoxin/flavodoxin oxidoreductase
MVIPYGNVYIAQIAIGASAQQTLEALLEAEAHDGPSLVIAYGHCIAHGIDMRLGLRQQKLAVDCGHWPLFRYRPASDRASDPEFVLDSAAPRIPVEAYAYNEVRYKALASDNPTAAAQLLEAAQRDIDERWQVYETLAQRWPPARRHAGSAATG